MATPCRGVEKNKNVIFEKLFFTLLYFWGVFGRDFFAKLLRAKMAKTCRFLVVFSVLRDSHEETEHAVEQAIFSSHQYAGLIIFFGTL